MQKNDTVRIRDCPETNRLNSRELRSEFGQVMETHYIFYRNITFVRVLWTNGKLTWELSECLEKVNG